MIDSSTLQGTSLADVIGIASWNNIKIKISFIWVWCGPLRQFSSHHDKN